MKISTSTLYRMIESSELITETEQHGHLHASWVLKDDTTEDISGAPVVTPMGTSLKPVTTPEMIDDIAAENLTLKG